MSYAIKINVENDFVVTCQLKWTDENDIIVIQKKLGVESADVQSLTSNIDAWIDDVGLLKKNNHLIGINVKDN